MRRHGLVRSPLRRTTDRVEAMVTAALAIVALLVVPVAAAIAVGTYQYELESTAVMATQPTPVTAILITDATPASAASSSGRGVTAGTTALARWQLPDGQQRSAPLRVDPGRRAGDQVAIWVDRHGNRTDPPKTPVNAIAKALIVGVDLVLGGWILLGALWWTICRMLNWVNVARWDTQWAHIEPRWSRRTWQ
jgi:hypothetical protein